MFFTKIRNFIKNNKKTLLFLSIVFLVFSPDYTFAAEASNGSDTTDSIIEIINLILRFASLVVALATQFVSWFMTPGWTTGSSIGISEKLHDLWIMMSNVVYLIFAFLLVWIALMNILGKGGDWELKQALPRFIGGVLIVPFSWLIINALISLSSVLTVSILTLPQDSFPKVYDTAIDKVEFHTEYDINLASNGDSKNIIDGKGNKKTFKKYLEDSKNIFGIMNIYTYGIMRVDDQGKVYSKDVTTGQIKKLTDISAKILIDIIFIVVYLILMVAILLAFFVRGVYIWIFMVISPLFGLMFFFKKMEGLENFSLQKFVGLALMPVYVAAALSFGLLFILVAGKEIGSNNCQPGKKPCVTYKNDISSVEFLGIKLNFKGVFSSANNDQKKFISDLKGSFGLLIIQVFGLAVLWIAVMAAFRTSDITKDVVQPFEQFGNSVGDLVKKAPTYAPIIPSPGGGMMSAESLNQGMSSVTNYYTRTKPGKGAGEFAKFFGAGGETSITDANNIQSALKLNNPKTIAKAIKDALSNNSDLTLAASKKELVQAYLDAAKKLNIKGYDKKSVKDIRGPSDLSKLLIDIDKTVKTNSGIDIIKGVNGGNISYKNLEKLIERQNSIDTGKDKDSGDKESKGSTDNSTNDDSKVKIDIQINDSKLEQNLIKYGGNGKNKDKIKGFNDKGLKAISDLLSDEDLGKLTKEEYIKLLTKKLIEQYGKNELDEKDAKNIAEKVAEKIEKKFRK